ncbi:MAG: tRNA (N6-isopentenyl adenosine(37)-C2)-methylthiotransferase MiaB [Lachnospiraceae bacterium]|nr:tRNA (N6-isopentenyl adenosine(37)-C2)-methylthiotransferase MiaB [Lachnospiraceae bacterium]
MNVEYDLIDIAQTPPEDETARQYYFIAKARQYLGRMAAEAGRRMTFCVTTFGCQMNARDSEKLSGILQAVGYEKSSEEDADLVLFNTCTVRENANNRVYGRLGYLNGYKKKNPHMIIGLCGCMMQEEHVVEKIRQSYGFVDLIFGTHNIFKLPELLVQVYEQNEMVVDVWPGTDQVVECLPNKRKYFFKSGVNIMYGCDNFCSYCIVPYVRGRERSRRPEEILSEIRDFVADGVVEVMLLGQNVNSYGKTLDEPVTFAQLLAQVEEIAGLRRIRFMTSHPKDLSDELIEIMGRSQKICPHLHLPLQSGSTRLLRIMNRNYTKEQYLALVEKVRQAVPEIAITTDIMVGFPGETEKDFEETMDVVRRTRFDSAFTFLYSPRRGTPAYSMEDQVPAEAAQQRFDRLLDEVSSIAAAKAEKLTGRVLDVLVEDVNRQDSSLVTGRLGNNSIVHLPGDERLIGQIVPVHLDECRGFYYLGSVVL